MATNNFAVQKSKDGLSVKAYRGEDMVLLAFDIAKELRTKDFVGFGIQYKVGADGPMRDVFNFLTFRRLRENPPDKFDHKKSMRSPVQKFRWVHVPSIPIDDGVTYRVSALFWNDGGDPKAKATVEVTIDLHSETHEKFLNVGFTRGYASSQAYARNFNNNAAILARRGTKEIEFDTAPFDGKDKDGKDREYPWLGFEARRLMLWIPRQACRR